MKTTNQTQQQNVFRTVTGKSIFYLGILSMVFVTSSFGNYAETDQQAVSEYATHDLDVENNFRSVVLAKPATAVESESELTETISTIASNYEQPIVEVIKENESIIESEEQFDFTDYFGRTIEEIILENEMIIESNGTDAEFPLDFKLIDNYAGENKEGFILKNKSAFKS